MSRRKKDFKQKLSEFTYQKPALDKHFRQLKKGMDEVCSILIDKKKK